MGAIAARQANRALRKGTGAAGTALSRAAPKSWRRDLARCRTPAALPIGLLAPLCTKIEGTPMPKLRVLARLVTAASVHALGAGRSRPDQNRGRIHGDGRFCLRLHCPRSRPVQEARPRRRVQAGAAQLAAAGGRAVGLDHLRWHHRVGASTGGRWRPRPCGHRRLRRHLEGPELVRRGDARRRALQPSRTISSARRSVRRASAPSCKCCSATGFSTTA